MWDVFELCNLMADFKLVDAVINDPHTMVLVHCGNKHAAKAFKYFKMMAAALGIQTRSVGLITQPLMNNEETYHEMRNFIFNP